MTEMEMVGRAQTVLGAIDSESLGVTLTHEHLLLDATFQFVEPTEAGEKELAHQPISLQNLNWVLHHHTSNLDNLRLDDEQVAIHDLRLFKRAGGNTIVEPSVRGLSSDPLGYVRISQATGVNVIMATGYYISMTYPPALTAMSEKEVADELVRDITVGIGDTGVRAGFLKGACGGTGRFPTNRIEDNDRKVLRALAMAQRRTGAAIGMHTLRKDLVAEIIEILRDAGADLTRIMLIHADRWGTDPSVFSKLLQAGCYVEFDGFGTAEIGLIPVEGFDYQINDVQRCDLVLQLIDRGYLERILISQDVFLKIRCYSYGGAGYAHILLNTVPLMRHKGITEKQIHTILVENPKRILAFAPVKE